MNATRKLKVPELIAAQVKKDDKTKNGRNFLNTGFLVSRPETDKAWLAGLMDKWFNFYIHKITSTTPAGKRLPYYFFAMDLNTDSAAVAARIKEISGHRYNVLIKKRRVVYTFRFQAKNALNIFRFTRKYSHARKEEIAFALKFYLAKKSLELHEKEMEKFKMATLSADNYDRRDYDNVTIMGWPEDLRKEYLKGYTNTTDYISNNPQLEEKVDIFDNRT